MKAAVLHAPEELRLEERLTPQAGAGELVLRVRAATVCGTDIRIVSGRKTRGVRFPSVLGHELAGEIVDVGVGVRDFAVGQAVAVNPVMPCRHCAYCRRGRENVCLNRQALGYEFDGGFAEYVKLPALALEAGNVMPIPQGMSFETAALAEPLACCVNGLRNVGVSLGDVVVVLGAGPIGLMHVALARRAGARAVIVSEPNAERREAAHATGALIVCDPSSEDVSKAVDAATDGLGADVVIVAIGLAPLANEALGLVCKGGRVNLFAGFSKGALASFDVNLVHYHEIAVTGASALRRVDYETAFGLLRSGLIATDRLITHRFDMSEAVQAIQFARGGKGLKVAICNG